MKEINWLFWQYIIGFGLIAILFYYLGVKRFASKIFSFEFIKKEKDFLDAYLGDGIGFVISQDGKIHKIHINICFKTSKKRILDNLHIVFNDKNFRFKQFCEYSQNFTGYLPVNIELPLAFSNNFKTRAEFQIYPYKDFKLKKEKNHMELTVYSDVTIRKKFLVHYTKENEKHYTVEKQKKKELPKLMKLKFIKNE